MKGKKLLIVLMVLGLMALTVTGYLVYLHYKTDITGFCEEGATFDCSLVNQSKYAQLFGIPMSSVGLLFYAGYFILTLALYLGLDLRKLHSKFKRKHAYWIIFLIPVLGSLFSLRLSYIEAFILHAWCPFCIIQQIIVLIMAVVAFKLLQQRHML